MLSRRPDLHRPDALADDGGLGQPCAALVYPTDPRWKTPVNSILVVACLVMAFILLSMLGVGEQEANQSLANAGEVHYAVAYVSLFALPVMGKAALRAKLPWWLKLVSVAGLLSSLVALAVTLYPIVDVVSPRAYALKIGGIVVLSNLVGLLMYRFGSRKLSPANLSTGL